MQFKATPCIFIITGGGANAVYSSHWLSAESTMLASQDVSGFSDVNDNEVTSSGLTQFLFLFA